jgi:hypothetical protein
MARRHVVRAKKLAPVLLLNYAVKFVSYQLGEDELFEGALRRKFIQEVPHNGRVGRTGSGLAVRTAVERGRELIG